MVDREFQREELKALRELANHPGWAVCLLLLERVCSRKSVERSNRLRKERLHEAVLMQGEIDGIESVPKHIENYMRELEQKPEEEE